MNPLRLVLIIRRFWPMVGGPQKVMADLAAELVNRGCEVTVLTVRWRPNWPTQICFDNVCVVRLSPPPEGALRTIRYLRSLRQWLADNRDRYDAVYVSSLKHEARAALRTVGDRVPVVLRAESAGHSGDCLWQIDAAAGRRIKQHCMKAAALVGPSRAIERELQAAGYPRPKIHHIANGVPLPPPRTAESKSAARSVLAEANEDLRVSGWMQLAAYTGRLGPGKGLKHLVTAWKSIVTRWPNARLLLVGEGPEKATLVRQIEASRLRRRVDPIGAFDDVETVLAAADFFVRPSTETAVPLSLIEAMAASMPIVAADAPGSREALGDDSRGLLVPPEDPNSLAAAMDRLLDDPALAARLGTAARQRAVDQFSLAKMADQHVRLFEEVRQEYP